MKADPKGVLTGAHYIDGNYAIAEGALAAGCRFFGGYPGRADLVLRVGHDGETYEAIARGPFNLANLPVLCDRIGPFGSPTSDSARTMVTADCRDALLVLYGFGEAQGLDAGLDSALDTAEAALRHYCDGEVTARWRAEP